MNHFYFSDLIYFVKSIKKHQIRFIVKVKFNLHSNVYINQASGNKYQVYKDDILNRYLVDVPKAFLYSYMIWKQSKS